MEGQMKRETLRTIFHLSLTFLISVGPGIAKAGGSESSDDIKKAFVATLRSQVATLSALVREPRCKEVPGTGSLDECGLVVNDLKLETDHASGKLCSKSKKKSQCLEIEKDRIKRILTRVYPFANWDFVEEHCGRKNFCDLESSRKSRQKFELLLALDNEKRITAKFAAASEALKILE